jgi:N-carbamoylputrescine amidase
MKVTVCQLRNDPEHLETDWTRLVAHANRCGSEMVLLPEMPFYPWPAAVRSPDSAVWRASVAAHDRWLQRLEALAPATVLGTRPVLREGKRFNEGFLWDGRDGYRSVHTKCYLPDEEGFWEASWYARGPREFSPAAYNGIRIGFLICTEVWFAEHAREYAGAGVHLVVCPRATPAPSADKWLAGGRTAAVVSGAFCLSSCIGGTDSRGMQWAGKAWVVEPEEGEVLATTCDTQPFITVDIDPAVAERAKHTYPRYVKRLQ